MLAPKQRVIHDITNRAQNITLPVVAVNIEDIKRAPNRVFNKLDNIYNPTRSGKSAIKMPVPIDITISMSIMTKYMKDAEQIISNFAASTNPYIILSWKEPTGIDDQVIEIRSEVDWSGSITRSSNTEYTASDKMSFIFDTSFTIKGWLFKSVNTNAPLIYFIDVNNHTVNKEFILDYDEFVGDTTSYTISATPALTNLFYLSSGKSFPLFTSTTINRQLTANNRIVMYGDMFNHTSSVLLSGNSDLTSSYPLTSITSEYTGTASGYLLSASDYTVLTDNVMVLDVPYLSGAGSFDIIVNNPAGWVSSYQLSSFSFEV